MEIKYYDERYYLSRFGVAERKLLEYWKEKNKSDNEQEEKDNSSLISLYDEYIKLAGNLVNEVSLHNSISKGLIISVFVHVGVFSYDDFKFKNVDDILNTRLGLNVLNGKGCCRNFSHFTKDIFASNNEFCENLAVIESNKKDKRKATRGRANHMINLIEYEGILYGFDTSCEFGELYYFINSFELLPIEEKAKSYMYYKPYLDFVYSYLTFEELKQKLILLNENAGKRITEGEYKDIVKETDLKLEREISLVQDFMKDTRTDIINIKEKIKVIKK